MKIEVLPSPEAENALAARDYPQVIKYMGSKAKIIDFVVDGIRDVHRGGYVCDLFAGACSLSGALGASVPMISSDIQEYSRVIASVYLKPISSFLDQLNVSDFADEVETAALVLKAQLPTGLSYASVNGLREFNEIESRNRNLVGCSFEGTHHYFTKTFSGTWWSSEQCVYIDAVRFVIDRYFSEGSFTEADRDFCLTCAMHAMAYCGQGTGHYAQYRDAKDDKSFQDISLYRAKSFLDLFVRRFERLRAWHVPHVVDLGHKLKTMDFKACLSELKAGTVYADPPYAFVHYSRFYHAIETFAKYDCPDLQHKNGELVKGRYRTERHQSPFSIKSQVKGAFKDMFDGVRAADANLVLSYSNTGLFCLEEMNQLARECFGANYRVSDKLVDHTHMTMGRREDRDREVKEALVLAIKQ